MYICIYENLQIMGNGYVHPYWLFPYWFAFPTRVHRGKRRLSEWAYASNKNVSLPFLWLPFSEPLGFGEILSLPHLHVVAFFGAFPTQQKPGKPTPGLACRQMEATNGFYMEVFGWRRLGGVGIDGPTTSSSHSEDELLQIWREDILAKQLLLDFFRVGWLGLG